jgi:RNA polymerase sigma factor (sigma-70 family)
MMTTKQTLSLYNEHVAMLKDIATSFLPSPIDMDDLIAEANLAFLKALRSGKYNPQKSTFTTYLHTCVKQAIRDMHRKEFTRLKLELIHTKDKPEKTTKRCRIIDIIDELNDDCKTIIKLILETPGDIKTLSKTGIRSHLLAQGWGRRRIKNNMDSLSKVVTDETI